MLKDRIEKVRNRLAGEFASRYVPPPSEFTEQLTRAATNVVNLTAREMSGGANGKQITDALAVKETRKKLELQELEQHYSIVYAQRDRLLHSFRIEDAADLREKLRFLAFRMLLAVGIAAVVLLTGYFAKAMEIPLPLLRLPG